MVRARSGFPGRLVLVMVVIVMFGLGAAYLYYSGINRWVDPRIKSARQLYEQYNGYAQSEQYDSVFWLMDTIQSIYQATLHYRDSYETGVLNNNRAAAYLSLFLTPEGDLHPGDSTEILGKAEKLARKSISIYTGWLDEFKDMDEAGTGSRIRDEFMKGLESYTPDEQEAFLDHRVKEIGEAREETVRRLSVSYTNLGTIKRHQQVYDSAALYYQKAISLWDRNLTAENNLNILLNQPLKKRNLLQKLFPPDK